jgi:hypothetical protein
MDQGKFAETVKRLEEVDAVIKKLDPAIRSDAFGLLKGYVAGGRISVDLPDDEDDELDEERTPKRQQRGGALDVDALVEEFETDKDVDNALLALAIYYGRHGRGPFKMTALKSIATELKLTVPDRLDMTFKAGAKKDGKEVLRKQADGWKVTPSGETWLKTTYGVSRGKTAPSADDDS